MPIEHGVYCCPVCSLVQAPGVFAVGQAQLHADNLKRAAECPDALFAAARFTAQYVRSVGQDVRPGKFVLLSASKAVRRAMKLLRCISGWYALEGAASWWTFRSHL